MTNISKKIADFFATVRRHRREPLRLEFILSDYCNLNCKGCTHYSPLAAREFESLAQLEASARHLGAVVGDSLGSVYLIGGETLLYPHLPEAMAIMRRYFPKTTIYLFTNGILLPKMSDGFWTAARNHKVVMAITHYPIAFDYDAAEALCRENKVEYEVFGDRGAQGSFLRFALDPKKGQNGRLSHFKCFNRGCISVVGDKIYPCSISACVGHLNKALGTDFRHEAGDWMAVSDVHDASDIRRLRDKAVPFCGYCKPRPTVTDYGPSRRQASEWVDE